MNDAPRIRSARWPEQEQIAAVVAEALHTSPLAAWLVPEPTIRVKVLTGVAKIWLEHAIFFGDIQVTDDLSAAAVGFNRYRDLPPPPNYDDRLTVAAGAHAQQFTLLDTLLTQARTTEAHYHLAVLAVTPAGKRRGLDTSMLAHHEARLDRTDLPSWTETLTGTPAMYQRHGYQPRPQVALPDGPVIATLRRNPRPRRDAWPVNAAALATQSTPARNAR
ncbi:GNAT family N-acetyltransferase [Micromonospora sp. NPDC050980]|uniref:GNAT family N-acetyltransferase n=1 Tax=Micromonospora sp. NPDC050980 TaxID=3155161 RepID=UPI0033C9D5E4